MTRRILFSLALTTLLLFTLASPMPAGADAAADGEWVQVGSYTPPFRRMHQAMAFDGTHTLLFGGFVPDSDPNVGVTAMNDTWSFDGTRWIPLHPETSPSPRAADAAWDPARGEVVLFGGTSATGSYMGDTWTWDGTTWTQEQPAHSPPARRFAGMAFDAVTNKVVLFGGVGSDEISLGDTWTWDGTDWTQLQPLVSPPPRLLFGFADGSSTSQPVLFGGVSAVPLAGGTTYGDTWSWDGQMNTWLPEAAAGAPVPRMGPQMAYDSALGKTILYGGSNPFWPGASTSGVSSYTHFNDTWTWDGSAWTSVGTGGAPRDMFYGAMAHDPTTHKTYLFGGAGNGGYYDDTWSFDGTGWVDPDHTAPGELAGAMLGRDSSRTNSALLFGGANEYSGYSRETWRWDGTGWHLLAPAHAPPPTGWGTMAFDPVAGVTVLFGGRVDTLGYPGPRQSYQSSETWTWDGTDWTQQQPTTSPPVRTNATMAYDAARGNIVLFGGADLGTAKNDTWTWDGRTWTEQHPATPPVGRFGAHMTYDPVRQEVVLFGGNLDHNAGRLDDTWTWDGKDWTEETPGTRPPARAHGTMAFDPRSGSSILFGGCDPCMGPTSEETWSWDGSDWTQLHPATAPSARTDLAVVSGDAWMEGGEVHTRPMLMLGGVRPPLGIYEEGTMLTADLWAFNAPELSGGGFHVYASSR